MRVSSITSTDLFVGTEDAPRQLVRVHLLLEPGESSGAITLSGGGVETAQPGTATESSDGIAEVAIATAASPGTRVPVRVLADDQPVLSADGAESFVEVAEPGWTMHMVSHFHYDPVWWNTQAAYTSEWNELDFKG